MQQDWTFYLAFAAGAAILALFFRTRRRRSGHLWVVVAILAIVAIIVIFGAILN